MLAIAPSRSRTSFARESDPDSVDVAKFVAARRRNQVAAATAPQSSFVLSAEIWIVTRLRDQNTARMNFTKNIGMLLLAIYLIIVGLITLFTIAIPTVVTGILALAAGIFILIGR